MKKLILLVLLCTGLLRAQDPAPAPIHLTFQTIGFDITKDDIFIKQAKGFVRLVIETNSISAKTYDYVGPAVMSVYRKAKTADKISYEPVGQVTFPPIDATQTGRFILVFSGGSGGTMRITSVADDMTAFPLQSVRVINALTGQVGVMVNKDAELLTPGQIRLFSVRGAKDNRVEIHIAVKHRNKWIQANNNVITCDPDSRSTIFLVNNSAPDAPAHEPPAIRFLTLHDRPKDKPTAQAPEEIETPPQT